MRNAEELHYKSDIAAELARRDMEIDRLRGSLEIALGTLADIGDNRAAQALPVVALSMLLYGPPKEA